MRSHIDTQGRYRSDVAKDLLVTRVLADGLLEIINKHGSEEQKALAYVWLHKVAEFQDGFDQDVRERTKLRDALHQKLKLVERPE